MAKYLVFLVKEIPCVLQVCDQVKIRCAGAMSAREKGYAFR